MIMNIVVLIFEVLYYSLFMKFAKNDGKFYKYFITFALMTVILMILNTKELFAYNVACLIILFSFKYIIKITTTLFDLFYIIIMLLFKISIEFIIVILFFNLLNFNIMITTIIFELLKVILVIILSSKIKIFYNKLSIKWNNNNFNIRYVGSILIIIYTIISIVSLIFYR